MRYHTGHACFGTTTAMALVLAALAVPVHAQETTTPLGRIVFGYGTDQVALDTPLATTVIDEEEINRQLATTVGEFFDGAPGVQAVGSNRPLGQTFNIRGWGEVPAGDEGRVIVLQDGATQYYEQYRLGSFFSDPLLFCNVEVLRGPASAVLYGSGAIGGVIRFETCDAEDYLTDGQTSQFRFSAQGETNGEGGALSARYATYLGDDWQVFANLNYRAAEAYVDGDGTEIEGSEFTALSALASATYSFDSSRSIRFIYEQWASDLDDTSYEQTGSGGFGTVDRETIDRTFSLIYEGAEAFGDVEVTLAYADTDVFQENANPGFPSGSVLFQDAEYGYDTLSLDARVTSDLTFGNVQSAFTYGATISRQNRVAEADVSNFIDFHPEGTADRIAIFGQSELDFGNGLTLVPGLRLEWAINEPGEDDPSSTSDSRETVELFLVSPSLAFTYDITDEFGIFGSIGQTQRAPNLDELYSYDPPSGSAPLGETAATDLEPEDARSVELGFTYSRAGLLNANDAFDARVTAFYSHVENLIERDSTDGTPYHRNIGEAEIYGLELEAAYASDTWFANLGVALIEGRNLSDDEVWSQLPQDSLSLTLGRRDEATGVEVGWRLNAFAELDYEGARFGQNRFPGYVTHDFFASWAPQNGALEGLEFRLAVDNVLDQTFINALDGDTGRGLTGRLEVARVWNF
ncbi:TonB-dependent receptor [Roseobacter sp. HKCCD8767]|uniref:TonB-dependent receptor domain-containing protein n=2 Tax=unclassified Roseobacter TaxID=196798 RepID=UPI001490F2D5|nr:MULTISPECIES: TonB-dependent receptor [unclassified Roseobacter]MBF9052461.1 TonB-dependent receptor [Rhodobacterales bacterium HKCCD4356]NNV14232.1 TonB-dependent receptor [Roseobacter sp. HKCCD7357]NNV53671.1 TonB-dependent receptor [Roseobacter sp. HKCCD9025]NNV96031.1 TonB-dependent receptor [Roseobacter sp. HKCCD8914]NNW13175.1 TonB-dependent receptor [Roseobacter sp. HKCCD8484]NNW21807.1 TonB-dependent receptor [Roseobacter sp. HKCCD7543]NNW89991.1 TonB-dependent receptor [Roseobact